MLSVNFKKGGIIPLKFTKLSSGSNRDVYKIDDTKVLKISKCDFITKKVDSEIIKFNPNVIEWHIWSIIKNTEQSKYFAPCLDISMCGKYLIMEYAPKDKQLFNIHKKIIFNTIDVDLRCDISRFQNYGNFKNNLVVVDYGCSRNIKFLKRNSINVYVFE